MESSLHSAPHLTRVFLCTLALLIASVSCVKLPRRISSTDGQIVAPAVPARNGNTQRININTASLAELERLPGIGKGLAARIVEYRQQFGHFRRAEHLMMVRGISDRRFQAMRALIFAE